MACVPFVAAAVWLREPVVPVFLEAREPEERLLAANPLVAVSDFAALAGLPALPVADFPAVDLLPAAGFLVAGAGLPFVAVLPVLPLVPVACCVVRCPELLREAEPAEGPWLRRVSSSGRCSFSLLSRSRLSRLLLFSMSLLLEMDMRDGKGRKERVFVPAF